MSFSTVARCESEKDPCKRVAPNEMFAADRRTLMVPSPRVAPFGRTDLDRGADRVFGMVGSLGAALIQRVTDQQALADTKAANTYTAPSMSTAGIVHKFPTL